MILAASGESSKAHCGGWADCIDLYQMHWPPEDGTPLEAYWQTLLDLRTEGKARAVGLSNHDVAQMETAEALGHVDSLQPVFNAIHQDAAAWTLAFSITGAIVGARTPSPVDGWIPATSQPLETADLADIADAIGRAGAGSGPARPPHEDR